MTHIAVAMTGASGAVYGVRLVEELLKANCQVSLVLTRSGLDVLQYELGLDWSGTAVQTQVKVSRHFAGAQNLSVYDEQDMFSPLASGSSVPRAMVVIPCSMGTAARLAAGISGNLLERAADVVLKERRDLILVPRETPLNQIHLENLLTLSRAGAHILPAMPGFYHRPQTLDDVVNHLVGKVLDSLNIEHNLFPRWGQLQE
ncbi:flavin prenyltransferase UbiX [Desulfuromonas sp. AOP6]|uniref:UbiX family flavin prenyltransferase n=1 Tax=Desulfuromonas sp. AOP6 TaxID=1566351 RepID=UPI0012806F54|nr:flavin prenyltransferase UbiX [Desulfuromonas sp. AOP6]BCA78374.1 flavin prenyltransferase UbiX [Desulfuromonas sp. AOP6]